MGGGLLPAPIYLCGAAYLTRVLARTRFQFVRKENRWAASLDLIPFKEECQGFESPPGYRCDNSRRKTLRGLPVRRQHRLDVRLPGGSRPELHAQAVSRVVRSDLREDHLDDLLLFVVGHDKPVVDDRFDSLPLECDRRAVPRWDG